LGANAPSSGEAALICVKRYSQEYCLTDVSALLSDPAKTVIIRDARGKPRFADIPQLCFSVSHSGAYGVCAVHYDNVGLDLQAHKNCDKRAIARRFFHPDEYDYLEKEDFLSFFEVWTAKESYLKYTGEGLSRGLGSFSVIDASGLAVGIESGNGTAALRHCNPFPGYSMCVCVASCTFTEQSLPIGYSRI